MRAKMIWGRYIETNSWMHRLDPRAKLLAMIIFLLIVVSIRSYVGIILTLLFTFAIIYSTNIPLSFYYRTVKPLRFLIGFIVLFSIIFVNGDQLLLTLGPIHIYAEGLAKGVYAASRIILFVWFSAILTFTTSPAKLTVAIADVLLPLRWIRISPQKISLMLSIALRFVPTLFDEAHKILKAQASRGADLKELPWRAKAKVLISLLIPVTIGAIKRAGELVDSMQARGYRLGAPRTNYMLLSWRWKDTGFLLLMLVFLIGLIWVQR